MFEIAGYPDKDSNVLQWETKGECKE